MDEQKRKPVKKALLLGLGLDNDDGHVRITRGKNFRLFGGSQDTHELMQEKAIKFNEHLDRRGKRLEDITPQEFHEIAADLDLKPAKEYPEKGVGPLFIVDKSPQALWLQRLTGVDNFRKGG